MKRENIHLPIIISVVVFVVGMIIWLFDAICLSKRFLWIPETSEWERILVSLSDLYYVPICTAAASVIFCVLFRKYLGAKS